MERSYRTRSARVKASAAVEKFVIPAKAGIQKHGRLEPRTTVFMDPGLRRDDAARETTALAHCRPACDLAAMRLRVATPEDEEAVSSVLRPSYALLMAEAYPPDLLAKTLPAITNANPSLLASGRYYLVESESGEPAGCGGWSPNPPGRRDEDPDRAHIRHFATHPDWTRRGVGRMLYERCAAEARAAGFTLFEAWSSLNGESFYASLGFRRIEAIETRMPGGALFPAIRMERAI